MYESYVLQLGDLVKVWIGDGIVVHPSVVTGFAVDGEALVTSKTFHHGVIQQRLSQYLAGRYYEVEPYSGPLSRWQVADRALRRLGEPWSLSSNCEHFAAEVQGQRSSSPQLQRAVTACAVIALVCIVAGGGRAA